MQQPAWPARFRQSHERSSTAPLLQTVGVFLRFLLWSCSVVYILPLCAIAKRLSDTLKFNACVCTCVWIYRGCEKTMIEDKKFLPSWFRFRAGCIMSQ